MKGLKLVGGLALCASLVSAGYVYGQVVDHKTESSKLALAEFYMEMAVRGAKSKAGAGEKPDTTDASKKTEDVRTLFAEAPQDPKMVAAISESALWNVQYNKASAKTVAELSQGARNSAELSQVIDEEGFRLRLLEVQQNQRIIGLLEQLVKRGEGK